VLGLQRRRWAGRPLLWPAARPAAVAVVAACVIVTAVLGILLAGQTRPGQVDRWVDAHLEARISASSLIGRSADLGNPNWVVIICAAAVLACLLARRFRAALLVSIAVPVAGGLTDDVLKPLIHRTFTGDLLYPSGHTTAAAAMAVAAVVVLTGPGRPPLPAPLRWLVSAVLLAVIPVVATGLVVIHYHYFTDTVGGAGVGIAVALGTALGLDAAAAWIGARAASAREEPAGRSGVCAGARPAPPS
jgi:membrane-associated phospholipid phosphatase